MQVHNFLDTAQQCDAFQTILFFCRQNIDEMSFSAQQNVNTGWREETAPL